MAKLNSNEMSEVKNLLTSKVEQVSAFNRPVVGSTYEILGIKEVTIGSNPDPLSAISAKDQNGEELTFWPVWIVGRYFDTDGNRHTCTVDGKVVNAQDVDNITNSLYLESITTCEVESTKFVDGKPDGTEIKTRYCYHWKNA